MNKFTNIIYLSNRDLMQGKARADAIVTINTCHHLSLLGYNVTIVSPKYETSDSGDKSEIFSHFGIQNSNISIQSYPFKIRDKDRQFIVRIKKFLSTLILCAVNAKKLISNNTVIISRDVLATYIYIAFRGISCRNTPIIYEVHDPIINRMSNFVYKNMDAFLFTTDITKELFRLRLKLAAKQYVTVRNGYSPESYRFKGSKHELRKMLSLSAFKTIAMYTGKLSRSSREVAMILECAEKLPDIQFIFVGGNQETVSHWISFCVDNDINNAEFVGFIPPSDISAYQLSADILLIYYPSDWPIADSVFPAKLLEYMATGNAIISVDLPTIREVLTNNYNAILIPPDNTSLLTKHIEELSRDEEKRIILGERAKMTAAPYSWENRSKIISEVIEKLSREFN